MPGCCDVSRSAMSDLRRTVGLGIVKWRLRAVSGYCVRDLVACVSMHSSRACEELGCRATAWVKACLRFHECCKIRSWRMLACLGGACLES